MSNDAKPFNPREAIAELVGDMPSQSGRRLSFNSQCAAFYALYYGFKGRLVAKAFGVTETTISQLGGCLPRDPRPFNRVIADEKEPIQIVNPDGRTTHTEMRSTGRTVEIFDNRDMNRNRHPDRIHRYRRVAEEFTRLGEEAFAERYYTEEVHIRLMTLKHEFRRKRELTAARPRPSGPNPTPGKWADKPFMVRRMVAPHELVTLVVGWRAEGEDLDHADEPLPAGWSYRCLDGTKAESNWSHNRLRTDTMAHDAAVAGYGDEVDANGDLKFPPTPAKEPPAPKYRFYDKDRNEIT